MNELNRAVLLTLLPEDNTPQGNTDLESIVSRSDFGDVVPRTIDDLCIEVRDLLSPDEVAGEPSISSYRSRVRSSLIALRQSCKNIENSLTAIIDENKLTNAGISRIKEVRDRYSQFQQDVSDQNIWDVQKRVDKAYLWLRRTERLRSLRIGGAIGSVLVGANLSMVFVKQIPEVPRLEWFSSSIFICALLIAVLVSLGISSARKRLRVFPEEVLDIKDRLTGSRPWQSGLARWLSGFFSKGATTALLGSAIAIAFGFLVQSYAVRERSVTYMIDSWSGPSCFHEQGYIFPVSGGVQVVNHDESLFIPNERVIGVGTKEFSCGDGNLLSSAGLLAESAMKVIAGGDVVKSTGSIPKLIATAEALAAKLICVQSRSRDPKKPPVSTKLMFQNSIVSSETCDLVSVDTPRNNASKSPEPAR